MNNRLWLAVAILALFVPSLALGQSEGKYAQELADDNTSTGRVWGNYTVRQSIEFGGRIADVKGNGQMYDTLVNLKSGPRLLGQELSIQSLHHDGSLFDNLYLSSFGFGGDPNDMARLRIEKNKWYNFIGLYRRDENFFDYDLFANPMTLNPGITNCSTVVGGAVKPCSNAFTPQANYFYTNSPHLQDTTRNMGDFNLTLFPQAAISVRLGFARNNNKGTVDSSLEDVNIDLTSQTLSRSDRWSFGVDVRPLKRTTLSFDQFFEHDKVDIDYVNNPQNPVFALGATSTSVSLPLYFPPCTITAGGLPKPYVTSPGVLNPLCNTGVFSYMRNENVRSNFPTSQLSLRSNYFRKLDVTASGTYSSGDSTVLNYNDLFNGLVSRTNNTLYQVTGTPTTDRVSGNADLGLTYHITKSWSVSDKFRWLDWRDPGVFNQLTTNCYSNTTSALVTLSSPTGAPCGIAGLFGVTSSGTATGTQAGSVSDAYNTLEAERTYFNTATLKWDPSRRLSAYLGYRYGRRELTTAYLSTSTSTTLAGVVGAPSASSLPLSTSKINQDTALGGLTIRPTDRWRINADAELTYADNSFAEISPRHEQRYRVNTVYKVNRWSSINAAVHFIESRNDWAESFGGPGVNLFPAGDYPAYGTKSHDRYYTLGASLNPNHKVSFDFGWTYMDQKFSIPACMLVTNTVFSATANPAPAGCPPTTNQPTVPAQFNIANENGDTNVPVIQAYQENTNTGYAILTFRPTHRVTLNLGYEITSTSGYDNWLRADTGAPLLVLGDSFGNAPGIPGNAGTVVTGATTSVGGIAFAGPFPSQPIGAQDFNWHKPNAGIAVAVCKGVTFKGNYAYFDYNEKEDNVPATQLVALPRNFHANVGTVSLKYAF